MNKSKLLSLLLVVLVFSCKITNGDYQDLSNYGFNHIGKSIDDVVLDFGVPNQNFETEEHNYYMWTRQKITRESTTSNGYHSQNPLLSLVTGNKESEEVTEVHSEGHEIVHNCKIVFRTSKTLKIISFHITGKCDNYTSFFDDEDND